ADQALGEAGCAFSHIVANGGRQCTYINTPSDCGSTTNNPGNGTLSGSNGNLCNYAWGTCTAAGRLDQGTLDGITVGNCWNYGLDNTVVYRATSATDCPDQAIYVIRNSSGDAVPAVGPLTWPTDQATCNAQTITTSIE